MLPESVLSKWIVRSLNLSVWVLCVGKGCWSKGWSASRAGESSTPAVLSGVSGSRRAAKSLSRCVVREEAAKKSVVSSLYQDKLRTAVEIQLNASLN